MRDVHGSQNSFSQHYYHHFFLWLMAAIFLIILPSNIACSSVSKGTKIPTYEEAKKEVLARGALVKPPVEKQYKFLQGGNAAGLPEKTVVTIIDPVNHAQIKTIKWGALVIDEKKAAELKAIKVQRNLLLKKLEAAKLQREANKIIYDASLQKAREAAKRSWWERNQGVVALTVGGTLGAALIIGIVYALTRGSGITVNTNTMVLQGIQK